VGNYRRVWKPAGAIQSGPVWKYHKRCKTH